MSADDANEEFLEPEVVQDAPTRAPTEKSSRSGFSMSSLFLLVTIAAVCAAVATSGAKTDHRTSMEAGPIVAAPVAAGVLAVILMAYSSAAGFRMLVRAYFIGAAAGLVSYLVLWKPPDLRVLAVGCLVLLSYGLIMRKLQPPRDTNPQRQQGD